MVTQIMESHLLLLTAGDLIKDHSVRPATSQPTQCMNTMLLLETQERTKGKVKKNTLNYDIKCSGYCFSHHLFFCSFGTIANLVLIFAFVSNAFKNKAFQPLDKIIVNMAVVNLLLCCYKEIPGLLILFNTRVFGPTGCRFLLYFYHTLRLISIWSVENLSFLHLIKIRRPGHKWSKFIHRHQAQYVNWSLAGCWAISITFHMPYLLYPESLGFPNKSNIMMTSTNCIGPTQNELLRIITYATVSLDFLLIILVILLNWFTIDLICRHRRQVRDTMCVRRGWNKHTAQATKILLSLLSLYVICWISSDVVWIAVVSGLMANDYDNDMLSALYGILSSIYYSVSSCIMVFGYRQVKDYLAEAGNCCRMGLTPTTVQSLEQQQ